MKFRISLHHKLLVPPPLMRLAICILLISSPPKVHASTKFESAWKLPPLQKAWHTRITRLRKSQLLTKVPLRSFLLTLRGGSTTATTAANEEEALRAYRWQQQLYLQSRSMLLRQALISRGLEGFHHSPEALEAAQKHVPVDWDCALATEENPKSCLYSFEAEVGTKVVAPRNTTNWITLGALNRLRRSDASKVEPLWNDRYNILASWLNPESVYSMYPYLSREGAILSFLLDSPAVLMGGLVLAAVTAFLVTLPFWETVLTTFLTSSVLWMHWLNWARIVHAALPLKLMVGQMVWKFVASIFAKGYGNLRHRMVEWECQIWEDCMPLTILEGEMKEQAEARAASATAEDSEEEEDGSDEDEDLDTLDSDDETDEDILEDDDDDDELEDLGIFSDEDE